MNTSLLLLLFFFTLFWPFRGLDFGVNLTPHLWDLLISRQLELYLRIGSLIVTTQAWKPLRRFTSTF